MTTYEATDGSIIHIELTSDDPDTTAAFYENTFGWTFEKAENMPEYTVWRAPNPPNGGLMAPQDETEYTSPATLFYINVEDLAETRDAIVDADGELIVEEMEVPEMGIFTIYRDPGGVIAGAWEDQYESEPEEDWPVITDETEPGSIVHFEFYSEAPEATRSFHEAVFGWTFETMEDDTYVMAYPPTPPFGGVMESNDQMPPGTIPYILVESAAEVSELIAENDGEVLRKPFDIEGWGTMAVFQAPGGIVHAVWESAEQESEEERPEIEASE